MENKEELYSEILKRVQRNYVHMAEIERITKELGSALSSNDRESVHLLLKMRQSEMDLASEVKQEIQLLIRSSTDEKEKLLSWLNGEAKEEPESFEKDSGAELSIASSHNKDDRNRQSAEFQACGEGFLLSEKLRKV